MRDGFERCDTCVDRSAEMAEVSDSNMIDTGSSQEVSKTGFESCFKCNETDASDFHEFSENSDVGETDFSQCFQDVSDNALLKERENYKEKYMAAKDAADTEAMEKYSTLYELNVLQETLELTNGEEGYHQIGGLHKDVRKTITSQGIKGYESHHIPAQSIQAENARELPTIALTKEDHSLTDTYRGKSNRTIIAFNPEDQDSFAPYKEEAKALIDDGKYVDLVRDELYNIKDTCGNRYDEGIRQYLEQTKKMIEEKGIPETKK